MSIIPPLLFAIAALAAFVSIWTSVRTALPAIAQLRLLLADAAIDRAIIVHIGRLHDAGGPGTPAPQPAGRRRLRPKLTTHRLHHFARAFHAA